MCMLRGWWWRCGNEMKGASSRGRRSEVSYRIWKGGAGSAKKGERDSLSVRPSTKALVLPLAEKLPFHSSSRLG